MIERRLVKSRIKDDCIVDYLRIHDTIDPAVIEEYRKIGIKCISCFVDGYDLYVYSEAEVDGEEAAKNMPTPADDVLQSNLYHVKDQTVPRRPIKEVFRMKRAGE